MADFDVEVPEQVRDASKAVNAALVSLGGVTALLVTLLSDGHLTGADVGTLVTAVLASATTVGTVYRTSNKVRK